MRHAVKVGCIHTAKPRAQPGRDPKVGKPVEEELDMVWAWFHDQDLLR